MAQSSSASFFPRPVSVEAFLNKWDDDIQRASRAGARRIGGTAEDAQDFAQEARIRIMRIATMPQAGIERYVRKVVANAIKNAIDRTDTIDYETIDKEVERIPIAEPDERIGEVRSWIDELPVPLWTIYQHVYVDGRTQRETARLMRISQPRVAQLHQRLLAAGRRDLAHLAA